MNQKFTKLLVSSFGQKYSEILEISLSNRDEEEIFKWFLASVLFGAPITEIAVIKTYKCFEKQKALTPQKFWKLDGMV